MLVFRPIIPRLGRAGHEVEVTARDYAQTLELLELHGIEHTPIGRHGGASRLRKPLPARRAHAAMRQLRPRPRLRPGAGPRLQRPGDRRPAARRPRGEHVRLRVRVTQHNIGCRLARRVMTPDSIPPERLRRFGVGPEKLFQYPGLKEEYYLADFEPDAGGAATRSASTGARDRGRAAAARRLALSPQVEPAVPAGADRLGSDEGVQAVVLPRTEAQREYVQGLRLPSVIVPAARRRRPEPGGARRSRRLGRRDDEPRGGRARHARLHDLRR